MKQEETVHSLQSVVHQQKHEEAVYFLRLVLDRHSFSLRVEDEQFNRCLHVMLTMSWKNVPEEKIGARSLTVQVEVLDQVSRFWFSFSGSGPLYVVSLK